MPEPGFCVSCKHYFECGDAFVLRVCNKHHIPLHCCYGYCLDWEEKEIKTAGEDYE